MFSCSDLPVIVPKSNCLLLACYHLCCFWASTYLMHAIFFNLQEAVWIKVGNCWASALSSNYFETQMKYCVTLFFANIKLTIMTIINQLIQFYLLLCVWTQQSIFVIILKASTSIVRSVVPFVLHPFPVETSPAFNAVDHLIGVRAYWRDSSTKQ